MGLDGAVVVVTGAGRGLGAALAITFADLGSRVVLCGRNEAQLQDIAEAIRERTKQAPSTIVVDLSDAQSVASALARIAVLHPTVDIVVNNGAMWLEHRPDPFHADEVWGVINSAVSGTFLLTQGLLPPLQRSDRPDIVTIGSISGLPNAALRTASLPFYAAKRAQAALADGFRQILSGTGIRSIAVHPPFLDDVSPLTEEWNAVAGRRKGMRATSRDVVEAVVFAVTRPRHVTLSSIVMDADDGGLF